MPPSSGPSNVSETSFLGKDDGVPRNQEDFKVLLKIHEELSCIATSSHTDINNNSSTPVIEINTKVKGYMDVELIKENRLKSSSFESNSKYAFSPQFFLQLYDPNLQITDIATPPKYATDVSSEYAQDDEDWESNSLRRRTYSVRFSSDQLVGKQPPIRLLNYRIEPYGATPPLIVHQTVRVAGQFCRLSLNISCNSSSDRYIFSDMTVVIVVPVDLDGGTAKMSRKGGKWDEAKRLLVWHIDRFPNAEKKNNTLDIQAQFQFLKQEQDQQPPGNFMDNIPTNHDFCSPLQDEEEVKSVASSQDRILRRLSTGTSTNSTQDQGVIPQFHAVVRCCCMDQIASGVEVNVCQEEDNDAEYRLTQGITKSFRLLYRVIDARVFE